MAVFKVEISEVLCRIDEIEAKNEDEALAVVRQKYRNQEIVLDADDFIGMPSIGIYSEK